MHTKARPMNESYTIYNMIWSHSFSVGDHKCTLKLLLVFPKRWQWATAFAEKSNFSMLVSFLPRFVPIKFVMFRSKVVWKYERNNGTDFPKFTWLEERAVILLQLEKCFPYRKTSPFSINLLELIQKPSSTRKAIKRFLNRSSTQWMKYMAIRKALSCFAIDESSWLE